MKNEFAVNWVAVFALIIASISILFSFYIHAESSMNKTRVEQMVYLTKVKTLSKFQQDSIIRKINTDSFKDDFYINQLSIQSDWIIFYVSVLFGIFGIVGFVIFDKKIEQIQKDNNDLKINYESHFSELLSNFNTLKSDLETNFTTHKEKLETDYIELRIKNNAMLSAISTQTEITLIQQGEVSAYFKQKLTSISFVLDSISFAKNDEEKKRVAISIIQRLKAALEELKVAMNSPGTRHFFIKNLAYDELVQILDRFLKINEKHIVDLVIEIRMLLTTAQNEKVNQEKHKQQSD